MFANIIPVTPAQLRKAATTWALKAQALGSITKERSALAKGKAQECLDIASDLESFGAFNSKRQAHRAMKLVAWTLPRRELDIVAQLDAGNEYAELALAWQERADEERGKTRENGWASWELAAAEQRRIFCEGKRDACLLKAAERREPALVAAFNTVNTVS